MGTSIPLPMFATPGSAAMDLCACIDEPVTIKPGQRVMIPNGFAIALPSKDYVALLFPRSGLSTKSASLWQTALALLTATIAGP